MASANIQQQVRVREIMRPAPRLTEAVPNNFGSVAEDFGYSNKLDGGVRDFVVTMTNGTGGALTYVLGDPTGSIAAASGAVFTALTSVAGTSVAAFNQMLSLTRGLVKVMNLGATSGAVQFIRTTRYWVSNGVGDYGSRVVNLFNYQRNTATNPNILTLDFTNEFLLSANRAFTFDVLNGQTLTVGITLSAYDKN